MRPIRAVSSRCDTPDTGQVVTLCETPQANPAMAMTVRVSDVDAGLMSLAAHGFVEHWRDRSAEGTQFVMCRDDGGVFVLLYSTA